MDMHMIATDVIFPSYLFSWTKHTHKEIVQQFIALFQMKEISNSTIYHFKFETEVYMWNKKEELHWFVMIHRKQFWSSLFSGLIYLETSQSVSL